jgi:putative ABC transport system substrate-binding protein
VRRREFITLLGGAAATWPIVARAQQRQELVTHARIAFLRAESAASTNQHFFDAFREGVREHGYVAGQNVIFFGA